MSMRHPRLALGILAIAVPAFAQEGYRHGRIRYVDAGVTLQRATETAAEEALPNLPFLPGDRIWTDAGGRVEFQFEGGAITRLDRASKLDYVAHEEDRGDRIVLRLWSGALSLRVPDGHAAFEVETPGGLVEVSRRGAYRIDTDALETLLSVYEGEAAIESGRRRVEAGAGERTVARRGEPPEPPQPFDRREVDDFGRWESEREEREAWAGDSRRYLPDELAPYAPELDSGGAWYHETGVGFVWRPRVAIGWQPYFNGHWAWTPYGWTWVPNEPWGWAPFHYGRWGFSGALGWYWIPGQVWGPAWVSWAVGSDYVGWCALGRRDRAVEVDGRFRGHAVPRGRAGSGESPWTYVRRGDVGHREVARRRVEVSPTETKALRIVDATRGRPTREFKVVEGEAAVPRTVKSRPTAGDYVPELRGDPATTIPFPVPRRRREAEAAEPEQETEKGSLDAARARSPRPDGGRAISPYRSTRPTDETRSPAPPAPAARPRAKEDDDDRHADPNRDVLRRLFRPLSEPRTAPSAEPRGLRENERRDPRPRSEATPRGERAAPRSEQRSPSPSRAAPEPRKAAPRPDAESKAAKRPPHKEREK
jgi:hypothetical protein